LEIQVIQEEKRWRRDVVEIFGGAPAGRWYVPNLAIYTGMAAEAS